MCSFVNNVYNLCEYYQCQLIFSWDKDHANLFKKGIWKVAKINYLKHEQISSKRVLMWTMYN